MKKILILIAGVALFLSACNKVSIKAPGDFTVTTNKLTYKVGDSVIFYLTGNPNNVNFFSGELNHNYNYINTTTETGGIPQMQFSSNVQNGVTTIQNLTVLASSNFNGTYDTTNVKNATWVDITNRAVLGTSSTNVSSGVINLSDIKMEGKPLYIAFRYLSVLPAINKQRQWTISSFQFTTTFPDGRIFANAAANADAGFGDIEFKGDSAKWVAGTTLVHAGIIAGYPGDDDWAISRAFSTNTVNSDILGAVNIKSLTTALPSSFAYVYTTPGTYTAVFVAENANITAQAQVVRKVTITITP
jgi:hypothetical protein